MFGESQAFTQTLALGFGGSPSPQKKSRQDDKQVCLPITTKMLHAAVATGGELKIHGEEANMVMLMGVVEALVKQTASIEFILNDSTGRVKVRQYLTDPNSNGDGLMPGAYTQIVGSIRTTPELHVSACFVHLVDSPDQVSYHNIESVHSMLKLTRKPEPMTPATSRPVATPQTARLAPGPTMLVDSLSPQKELKAETTSLGNAASVKSDGKVTGESLRARLLAYLRETGANQPEGLTIAKISEGFSDAANEIQSALEALVSEGEVFNTIDDQHFSTV